MRAPLIVNNLITKRSVLVVFSVLLLFGFGGLSLADQSNRSSGLALNNPIDLNKLIGKRLDAAQSETLASFLMVPKDSKLRAIQTVKFGGVVYSPNLYEGKRKFLLMTEVFVNDESDEVLETVLDVIEIPRGLELAGWEGEYDCIYEKHHQENVFAIGKWKAVVAKSGLNQKVYMSPIVKAWKVDFETKNFIEIPKHQVSCINHNSTDAP